ncbi:MAG: phosphatase PAP2 family protein [Slackia sp.]|nr:phosphatase PAP2 family protein [Slackia sp.]
MYAERYRRMSEPLRRDSRTKSLVLHVNSLLTAVGYIAYPLLLVLLAATGNPLLVRAVAVPAAAFVAVSLLRRVLNAPRPYEKDGIDPIIYKDTKGRSFPSRHAFSMAMIAMTWMAWMPAVGSALLIASAFMATVRVVGGVHYPKDVIAGIAVAVICGIAGFWIA